MNTHTNQPAQLDRPTFDQVAPSIQALVLKAAKKREAAGWKAIKDKVATETGMSLGEVRATRKALRSTYERAAVMIFNARAEGAHTWETWVHYMRLARAEEGLSA